MQLAKQVFQCTDCETYHDDREDAVECCQPLVSLAFMCTRCNEVYVEQEKASECCAKDEDLYRPTADQAELEALGQQRISFK